MGILKNLLHPVPLILLLLSVSLILKGQGMGGGMGGESSRIEGRAKFMPIPYINYDRSFGFTAGAVPILMLNPVAKDTISPSSIIGAVGTYSTSKTWFLMGFGVFFLNEDRWRITTAGGTGTVFYQFFLDFGPGFWIPYQSEASFFVLKVERKIWEELYGGISYIHANVVTQHGKTFPFRTHFP
jgi:hypothetical protein